jgi:hypothetical protein
VWRTPDTVLRQTLKCLLRHGFMCRREPTIWAKKEAGAQGAGFGEATAFLIAR